MKRRSQTQLIKEFDNNSTINYFFSFHFLHFSKRLELGRETKPGLCWCQILFDTCNEFSLPFSVFADHHRLCWQRACSKKQTLFSPKKEQIFLFPFFLSLRFLCHLATTIQKIALCFFRAFVSARALFSLKKHKQRCIMRCVCCLCCTLHRVFLWGSPWALSLFSSSQNLGLSLSLLPFAR